MKKLRYVEVTMTAFIPVYCDEHQIYEVAINNKDKLSDLFEIEVNEVNPESFENNNSAFDGTDYCLEVSGMPTRTIESVLGTYED